MMEMVQQTGQPVTYPLTHPQKRIWYIEKIYPGTSLHNIGGTARIKGEIDFMLLEKSINMFIKKNEGLRLRIIEVENQARQYVHPFAEAKLDYFDFSTASDPEAAYQIWVDQEARRPMPLENASLYYFALFKINERESGYMAKFHHIISDGWTIEILSNQVVDTYIKLRNQEEIHEEVEHSYLGYIEKEQEYLASDKFIKNKQYWNEKFATLPEDFLKNHSDAIEGNRLSFQLDPDLYRKLNQFTEEHGFSLNTFFATLMLLYLYKTTQQSDVVIGSPVLNRSGKSERSIVGMFTSTMPLRYIINPLNPVITALQEINGELRKSYFHQKYPFDLLMQDLELKKKGFDQLFDICVNYYNTKLNINLTDTTIENYEFYSGKQLFSINLVIKDWSDLGELDLDVHYKCSEYQESEIHQMVAHLTTMLRQMIHNPMQQVREIVLVSEEEKRQLIYAWNATRSADRPHDTVVQLFEDMVERYPDRLAVSFEEHHLTYRELNHRANQLARFLQRQGVKQETWVGLMATHSIETVVGIMGVLKAGGAYVPMDPSYPAQRIQYILNDAGISLLLTNCPWPNEIHFGGVQIQLQEPALYQGDGSNLTLQSTPDHLAYIIYTSGSTGQPKGVMVEHRGLANYLWWARKTYLPDENEAMPLYSSLSFDLTVTSLFTPLIGGHRVIVYREKGEEYVLYRILKDRQVTVIKLTPSHLNLIKEMDNRSSGVKRLIIGGENLKVDLAKAIDHSFGGAIDIYNEYGPTETVVGCMIHRYDVTTDTGISVPIGVPADNVQIYLLDQDQNPVPAGHTGEIYISGEGVARGYWKRDDLTGEKFIENPFIAGKRMYRSGDLGRMIAGNRIEYLGRADRQVKIQGYRIEPGEIETVLLEHTQVREAVVIDRVNEQGDHYLCAYVVSNGELQLDAIRSDLAQYLSPYMIPQYIVSVEKIPLTANGKVDWEALPAPEERRIANTGREISTCDLRLQILLEVMQEILRTESITETDNFYHLGGDSIQAIYLTSRLRDRGISLTVKDILSYPIIGQMAMRMEVETGLTIDQAPCAGTIEPTPITAWFFSQGFEHREHYNQSIFLELHAKVETSTWNQIFTQLVWHHDTLRINLDPITQKLFYNPEHRSHPFSIVEWDLSHLAPQEQWSEMERLGEEIKSGFDLEKSLLFRVGRFSLGANGERLLLTAHHLLVDGVSWRILLDDLQRLLEQSQKGEPLALPVKTHSYQRWAEALHEQHQAFSVDDREFWKEITQRTNHFPIDAPIADPVRAERKRISAGLSGEETQIWLTEANRTYHTEPHELLIMALALTLQKLTGQSEMILELEGHGRDEMGHGLDVTRTVGWFTSIYPAYLTIQEKEISDQIKSIKEQIRAVTKRGYQYGILQYLARSLGEERFHPTVRFNYLGDFDRLTQGPYVTLLAENPGRDHGNGSLTCLFEVNGCVLHGSLIIEMTYQANRWRDETIADILSHYLQQFRAILTHCCERVQIEFTPSDFSHAGLSQDELDALFDEPDRSQPI